jgi:type II secretory pathway component PulM
MMQWWLRLAVRERALLLLATGLVVGTAFYGLVWQPLAERQALQLARHARLQADLAWMLRAGQRFERLRAAGGDALGTSASLLSVVDEAARADGIKPAISQLNPEGDRLVRLALEAVEFNKVLRWLAHMQAQGVRLDEMTFSRHAEPGQVQGRLTLSRGAGG